MTVSDMKKDVFEKGSEENNFPVDETKKMQEWICLKMKLYIQS